LTEHFVYEGLNAFRYTLVAGAELGEDAIKTVNPTATNQVVALLLQEQPWLKKRLK
jgi:hypothetical protein